MLSASDSLGKFMEHMVKQHFFVFSVLYSQYWYNGRFISIIMVVERGDATSTWSFSNISALQLVPLCYTVYQLCESDT
jgi:hypothetical protein